jgi:tetratricopeptide (TPR) repeat protein
VRLTALLLTLAVTSASATNDRAMRLLDEWILSVDQHSAGESDAALSHLTGWSYNDLELMRGYVEALVELPVSSRAREARRRIVGRDFGAVKELGKNLRIRGDFEEFKKRAVMLHTDAAILDPSTPIVVALPNPLQPQWTRGNQRGVIVKSFDGRVENFEFRNLHWDFAMDVLDTLLAEPRRDPVVAEWYRAVGAYFVSERRFADAQGHFARARRAAPDDPRVLFGEACLNETLAAPRIQNYVKVTTLPNGLYIMGVEAPATHWRRAETLLRRAISIDPRFAEARLRLGRVLIVLGRQEEGLQLLERAIADSPGRLLTFYAHLFSGDAALSLGRSGDAQRSYERALELFPDSQAAQLGLAATLRAAGDPEALAAMLPTLTKAPGSRDGDDPWWDYYDGDAAQVDKFLAELRAPFTNPRK